jgi:nitric oxide reductase NorQ protein
MRSYAVYYRANTAKHKNVAMIVVPSVDNFFVFSLQLLRGTEEEWLAVDDWRMSVSRTAAEVASVLKSGAATGCTPVREWAMDLDGDVWRNPTTAGTAAPNHSHPVYRYFQDIIQKHIGTEEIGTGIPPMKADAISDHFSGRAAAIGVDGLSSIALRTGSGPRSTPKTVTGMGSTGETFTRPNGETYYSRQWGQHSDIGVLRKAREIFEPVYLYGPPGTGKTAALEAAFGDELVTIVGTADTTVADLMGNWVAKPDGTFLWFDGPAVWAAEQGKVLFVDEIGLVDSKELSPLYPLMDGRGQTTIPANPERQPVKAAPGFMVVAATNPDAPGVHMSEALISRLTLKAEMTTDYSLLENQIGVNSTICRLSSNLEQKRRDGTVSWAPQFRDLIAFKSMEENFGYEFAIANLLAGVPDHDYDEVTRSISGGAGVNIEGARIV